MKRQIRPLLVVTVCGLLLVGCCTTQHVAKWEYKVVPIAKADAGGPEEWRKNQEALMNELGKDGWVLVTQNDRVLYFGRPAK